MTDTEAHALAHLLSVQADVVVGVPERYLNASLLSSITYLGRDATTWASEHNVLGQPGVRALMMGLSRSSLGRLVMDPLNEFNEAQIRHVAERAARGAASGRSCKEEESEEEDTRQRNRLR